VNRVLGNSSFNLAVQALQAAIYLVVFVILARGLSQEEFGRYYFFFGLTLVVQLVVEAGVGTVLTYRIVKEPAHWRRTVAEAAGLYVVILITTAAVFAGLGLAYGRLGDDPRVPLCLAAAGVACLALQVQRFCSGVFRGFERFGPENLAKLLQGITYAGLVAGTVLSGAAGVPLVLALFAATQVGAALLLLGVLHWRWRGLGCRWDWPAARGWLAQAVPLGVGDIFRGPTWQLDVVLLGLLGSGAAVGIYSVANRPLGPLNMLPPAILLAVFPTFVRAAGGDRGALNRAFTTSSRILWMASLPLAVGIVVCAAPLITLLAGASYLEATLPMQLLIAKVPLAFVSAHFRFLFTALGRQGVFAALVGGVFALETAVQVALIPHWGYLGACAGSLAGEITFTAAGLVLCRRLGVTGPDWGAMLRAAAAGAAMASVLWLAQSTSPWLLPPALILSAGLYLLLCLVTGALRRQEIRQLAEVFIRPRWRGQRAAPARDGRAAKLSQEPVPL
jgi:O-antigen/teichoic acid export membrane protein